MTIIYDNFFLNEITNLVALFLTFSIASTSPFYRVSQTWIQDLLIQDQDQDFDVQDQDRDLRLTRPIMTEMDCNKRKD